MLSSRCALEQDRLQTGEQLASTDDPADYPPSTLRWALVRGYEMPKEPSGQLSKSRSA